MSKTLELCEELKRRIASSPDGRLPSKSILSKEFGISAGTVSNAIRALKDEGRLRSVPGKGVFLVEPSSGAVPRHLMIGLCGCYLPGEDVFASKGVSALACDKILQGAQEAALESSCALAMLPWSVEGFKHASLRSLKLDGLIIAGGAPEIELLKLARSGIPSILANYPAVPAPQLPFFDFDNAWSVAESVRLLKERGRRRIAFLTLNSHSVPAYGKWIRERFIVALAEQGLAFDPAFYAPVASESAASKESASMLSSSAPPDAFICWTPEMVAGVASSAAELGLSIPSEISVIASCAPVEGGRCTHFLQPRLALGRALFDALRKRIDDPFANVSGFIKLEFIDRGTI